MYHNSPNGLMVRPHSKLMPPVFLYGQTIEPVQIEVSGSFEIIIFQLYPFTIKRLFGIVPASINDDCYDLSDLPEFNRISIFEDLHASGSIHDKVHIISEAIRQLVEINEQVFDPLIRQAVQLIIGSNGKIFLKNIVSELHTTKRTLERKFFAETGLRPKQFAKIIQFQNSLTQLNSKEYNILADIVYKNGYADQSHFIRVFKAFTGKTPKQLVKELVGS